MFFSLKSKGIWKLDNGELQRDIAFNLNGIATILN